jgi:hypothetical protein
VLGQRLLDATRAVVEIRQGVPLQTLMGSPIDRLFRVVATLFERPRRVYERDGLDVGALVPLADEAQGRLRRGPEVPASRFGGGSRRE